MSQTSKEFWGSGLVNIEREIAAERREDEKGYRYFRNASFVGFVGLTGFMNKAPEVNSMPLRDQLLFNAGGIGVALLSAAVFERGRRRMERAAVFRDGLADEIAAFEEKE